MRTVKQSFYDTFTCIAGDCPGTCCQGWEIEIDEDTLQKYRDYEGPCKAELVNGVNYDRHLFRLKDNYRCFMLRDDGLCKLVKEHGEPILCDTCHMFPRHCEEYEGVREWSVTLSCPEVAHIVITGGPAEFVVTEDDEPDPLEDDFEDFDLLLYTKLEDSREIMYSIVRDKDIPIFDRMATILRLAVELQRVLDDNCVYLMDDIIEEWKDYSSKVVKDDFIGDYGYILEHFHAMNDTERLTPTWQKEIDTMEELVESGRDVFDNALDEYNAYMDTLDIKHEDILENILMSFIYTFYLGAVYDDMLYAKIAMSIYFTVMIDRLVMGCRFHGNEKEFSLKKYEEITYRFTRELEHSDNNLNHLEEYWDEMFGEED